MPKQHRLDLSRRDFLRTGAALTATGAAALAESETQAKTTTRPGRKRPNILYVFSDQHRAKALGCYGDPNINTPILDKFATQGIRMDACMSSTPVCSPHRTCLMTGQYSHNHGTMSNGVEFESQLPCLAETFCDAGYRTGYAFMQMIYGYVPWPGWRALRTRRYMYARTSDSPWLLFDELKDPQELNNLVDDPDHRDTIREMDRRLEKIMRDSGDSWDITATTGDLKNWRPGGKKTKSNNLGVDWPGRVLP